MTDAASFPASSVHLASPDELTLVSFLSDVGAFRTRHSSHYTLASHLLGTYGLLKAVSAPQSTATAGGLHSLYGTIRFPKALLDSSSDEHRARVRGLFGEQAELLAHTFCTINRPVGLEHLDQTSRRTRRGAPQSSKQDEGQGRISLEHPLPATWDASDASSVESVQLDPALVHQLRLLDAANMIEQGEEHTTLARLPTIRSVWKEHLATIASPPSDPPLFAHFFHFSHHAHHLPCVRLSSGELHAFEAFHQQLLALIPDVDVRKQRVSRVRLHSGGLTGEVAADEGTDLIDFSAEQLRLLASNPPGEPYELVLGSSNGTVAPLSH